LAETQAFYFITEDVDGKYVEWSRRGVRFESLPSKPQWGGTFARFEEEVIHRGSSMQ